MKTQSDAKRGEFIEFKVQQNKNILIVDTEEKQINITITDDIDSESLPYLQELQLSNPLLSRVHGCIVVARGDAHSPEEIFDIGGFHPSAVVTNNYKSEEWILSAASHRVSSQGSGFVSCTSNLNVAKAFNTASSARDIEDKARQKNEGYVYLLKITGAMAPGSICHSEKEYSAAGGVDAKDIIAYRKVSNANLQLFNKSSIFISSDFIRKYPAKIKSILDAFLEQDEILLDPVFPQKSEKKINSCTLFHSKSVSEDVNNKNCINKIKSMCIIL